MQVSARAQAFVDRHARRNFLAVLAMISSYNGATAFIYGATVLSVYASHLTDSATLIGLIPAIQTVGMYLPQLLMVRRIQCLPRKHPFVLRWAIPERLPYLLIGLSILLWPEAAAGTSYGILVVGLIIATWAGGILNPAIMSMMATIVRPGRRGVLFGVSNALGGLLGALAALVVRKVLGAYPFPQAYGVLFLLSFAAELVCYAAVALIREPPEPLTPLPPPGTAFWSRIPELWSSRPDFRRFLLARVVLTLGTMGTAFYVLYGRQRFGIGDAFTGNLTLAGLLGQALTVPIMGALGDRIGHRPLVVMGALMVAAALLIVLLAPSAGWLYAAFALALSGATTVGVCSSAINLSLFTPTELPAYGAIGSTMMGIAMVLAPVIGGWLVDGPGYGALFAAALVANLLGAGLFRWGLGRLQIDH